MVVDKPEYFQNDQQVVCLRSNYKIGANGATLNSKGRSTPVSSVLLSKKTKTLYVGYEDGMITADGMDLF